MVSDEERWGKEEKRKEGKEMKGNGREGKGREVMGRKAKEGKLLLIYLILSEAPFLLEQ